MLLVSWYVPVITWLCSRAIWLQWRPLLTIESPVAQWLQHPGTRIFSELCFSMYLHLICYWRPSKKKLKLQNTACTKENGIRPRFREQLVRSGFVSQYFSYRFELIDKSNRPTILSKPRQCEITDFIFMIWNSSATSNGIKSSLSSNNGGHCATSNMKMVIYICNGSSGENVLHPLFLG